ncbi:hypothetical protein ABZ863_23370 [Saccharomonospora sp. NPDC046836]|uniref:hypothetical protein n=1 Tax=Saccharomonospora sp. NPDC046836 TaxID=3156921 RepID=UPI0034049A23
MTVDPAGDAQRRAAFRAFVREHHPDVGGDPEIFAAGLAHFRDGTGAAPARRDRFDAPVVFVTSATGPAGAARWVRQWWRRRRRPPRVR